MIHPVPAALDAIALHFGALAGVTKSARGWPEHVEDLDLSDKKTHISVVEVGKPVADLISPTEIEREDLGASAKVTYRLGYLTFAGQLDLWVPYRVQRDEIGFLVEDAFHNVLPRKVALELASVGYHGRPLTITVEGTGAPQNNNQATAEGVWRMMWEFSVSTDLVAFATSPKQAVIELQVSTDLGGVQINEPPFVLTP